MKKQYYVQEMHIFSHPLLSHYLLPPSPLSSLCLHITSVWYMRYQWRVSLISESAAHEQWVPLPYLAGAQAHPGPLPYLAGAQAHPGPPPYLAGAQAHPGPPSLPSRCPGSPTDHKCSVAARCTRTHCAVGQWRRVH